MALCQQCHKWLSLHKGGVYSGKVTYYECLNSAPDPTTVELVPECPECSMLSSLLIPFSSKDDDGRDGIVRIFSAKLLPVSPGNQEFAAGDYKREVQARFMHYFARKGSNESPILYICFAAVFTGSPKRVESVHKISPQPRFDSLLISRWIEGCKCQYALESPHTSTRPLPVGMRLIDLEDNCLTLVQPSTIPRYVALSYMWEIQEKDVPCFQTLLENVSELSAKDGLLNRPFTGLLQDCMNFCRDLGHRYLWIDRFCIIQDDFNGSKMAQICAMDSIYSCAAVTLICALNSKNATGLPGYRSVERTEVAVDRDFISTFDYNEGHFQNVLATLSSDAVKGSLWETRGWTYQELFLSVRRLVVSNRHVFFECPCLVGTELLSWKGTDGLYTPGFYFKNIPDHEADAVNEVVVFNKNAGKEKYEISDFTWALRSYTQCDLTFVSDSLNAFLGICSEMAPSLGGYYICGIPVKFLSSLLLWRRNHDASSGRESFQVNSTMPSWSWAQRFGPVEVTGFPIEPMTTCDIWHYTFPPGLSRVFFSGCESMPSSALSYSPSDLVIHEALKWTNCLVFQAWTMGSDNSIMLRPGESDRLWAEVCTSEVSLTNALMDYPLHDVIDSVELLFLADPEPVVEDRRKAGGILVRRMASEAPGVTVYERIGLLSVSPRRWNQCLRSLKLDYGEVILI